MILYIFYGYRPIDEIKMPKGDHPGHCNFLIQWKMALGSHEEFISTVFARSEVRYLKHVIIWENKLICSGKKERNRPEMGCLPLIPDAPLGQALYVC